MSAVFLSAVFLSAVFLSAVFLSAVFLSAVFLSAVFLTSIIFALLPPIVTVFTVAYHTARKVIDITAEQRYILRLRNTDVDGALERLSSNQDIYETCLKGFLEDTTVAQLNQTLQTASWDDAFTAAHALKGLAGNMGFVPLMHDTSQLIVLIRGGRLHEIPHSLEKVNSSYRDIIDAIKQFFAIAGDNKGDIS